MAEYSGSSNTSEDLTLPKATVQKILSEILPQEFTFTKDAKEALIECCIEFIMILSAESNDIAEKELKKTISSDHVTKALEDLGFLSYLPPIEKVLKEHKENYTNKSGKIKNKFQNSGFTEEELLKQQEELFRASRNKLQHQNSGGLKKEDE
ncbi:hypothetical protein PACTADRAFT_51528 [Pachysolen tannophilus NRRL Y-2460]|uniref:Transcription factor CBF/NF-Y/archaeal histone domain-containing protein n=1 Tax=Pachysolen tannophilus NRRL Y-2460 TaxID=669874 RepID=A0A1E4TPT7_PACTA|nr:hypothetical protein PACTADRAFT_51528 [Pachysolen tannophilus NRRL Y-2460]